MATKTKLVTVKVSPEEVEIIKKLGGPSKIINDAIKKYLKKEAQSEQVNQNPRDAKP